MHVSLFGTTSTTEQGRGLLSELRDHDGHVVPPAAEVPVQDAGDDAGVLPLNPWIPVQVPVCAQAVRMHDDCRIGWQWVLKFLEPLRSVTRSAIHRDEALAHFGLQDRRADVAEAAVADSSVIEIQTEHRQRRAARPAE